MKGENVQVLIDSINTTSSVNYDIPKSTILNDDKNHKNQVCK